MIYLFHGDEQYLISQEVKSLRKKFSEHAFERFDAVSTAELTESVATPSLFSPSRFIAAHNIDLDQDQETLIEALKNLNPQIELAFVSPKNLNKRKKIYKLIDKTGEVKEFKPFADWQADQVISWIIRSAAALSKKIDQKTAGILFEISGKNLLTLDSELKKLAVYTGTKASINEEDVKILASQKDVHVFSFVDALKEKKIKKALSLQEKVLADRAPIVTLVSLIASQFRTLFCVKLLQDKKQDRFAIGQKLGYHPFYVKKCMEQTRGFSAKRLREIMELLYSTDLKLKRGESGKVLLPLLVEDICCGQ